MLGPFQVGGATDRSLTDLAEANGENRTTRTSLHQPQANTVGADR